MQPVGIGCNQEIEGSTPTQVQLCSNLVHVIHIYARLSQSSIIWHLHEDGDELWLVSK